MLGNDPPIRPVHLHAQAPIPEADTVTCCLCINPVSRREDDLAAGPPAREMYEKLSRPMSFRRRVTIEEVAVLT